MWPPAFQALQYCVCHLVYPAIGSLDLLSPGFPLFLPCHTCLLSPVPAPTLYALPDCKQVFLTLRTLMYATGHGSLLALSPKPRYLRLVRGCLRGGLGKIGDWNQSGTGRPREPLGKDVVTLLLEGEESVPAADAQFLCTPSSEVVERAEESGTWGGKAARLNGSGLF